MARPRRAAKDIRYPFDINVRAIAIGVYLRRAWSKHAVDPFRPAFRKVALRVSRVAPEVLGRAELCRVHEYGKDSRVILGLRSPDERKVPLVQVAHSRNEPDRPVSTAHLPHESLHLCDRLYNAHNA